MVASARPPSTSRTGCGTSSRPASTRRPAAAIRRTTASSIPCISAGRLGIGRNSDAKGPAASRRRAPAGAGTRSPANPSTIRESHSCGLDMITADLLSRISLFAKSPKASVPPSPRARRTCACGRTNGSWSKGQAPGFYGLLEGHIDVLKVVGGREQRLTTYGPGDYFGEVPLLLGSPAIASLPRHRALPRAPARGDGLPRAGVPVPGAERRDHEDDGGAGESPQPVPGREPGRGWSRSSGHPTDPVCYEPARVPVPQPGARLPGGGTGRAPRGGGQRHAHGGRARRLARGWRRPFRALAEALGLQTAPDARHLRRRHLGGGPAGLAAAVYGASEGLRTLLVERTACGGQAGTSSRIENYLGFPGGLSATS